MALQERTVLGKVTINHKTGGHCEVQNVIEIYDDVSSEIKSERFVRTVVDPGDDARACECLVDHITKAAWTKEIRDKAKKSN